MMKKLKDYLPKNLFGRGIVMIATPILLLQIALVYLIVERYWDRVSDLLSENTAREISLLIAEPNQTRQATLAKQLGMLIIFTANEKLPQATPASPIDFSNRALTTALKQNIKNQLWVDTTTLRGNADIRIAIRGGVLQIIVPLNRVHAQKTYQIILWITVLGIIVMLVAILFLRNQVRPIQRLAVAAKRFGRGLEVRDFVPTGASEVREAGAAFLDMRDNLRTHIAQRTHMLSAISHDLRTAITRLKLQAALLPQDKERSALENDIDSMEKMLLGYLDFARGEGSEEKPVLVDCKKMLQELTEPYKQVRLDCPDNFSMRVRENAMRRCLDNLIHNALTYGKQVKITALQQKTGLEIIIDDDGTGIAEKDYDRAFRPFARLDEARNQNISGTGLGLAIAQDIIQTAGGTIKLDKSPQGGLRVQVFLPF